MCWEFKVFFRVFSNLAERLWVDIVDASYKMFAFCGPYTKDNVQNHDDVIYDQPKEQLYQEVNREQAEELLDNKQNGTFLIRPSHTEDSLGTISINQDDKIFHLNIRRRPDGRIALGSEKYNEKSFKSINCMINYHISNYLILYSRGETYRTLLLPYKK